MASEKENVLILGASPNPSRYAYLATLALCEKGHNVFLVGVKKGEVVAHTGVKQLNILRHHPDLIS